MQQWWRCHCILARLATYISISINADASYKHQRQVFCKYIWMWSKTTYSHCSFGHQVVSFQYSQLTTWYHILSKYVRIINCIYQQCYNQNKMNECKSARGKQWSDSGPIWCCSCFLFVVDNWVLSCHCFHLNWGRRWLISTRHCIPYLGKGWEKNPNSFHHFSWNSKKSHLKFNIASFHKAL